MLIDPYQPNWQAELLEQYRQLPAKAQLVLLIDGAFVPGLFRQVGTTTQQVLLYEWLPGCSDRVRDVSPFLVQFEPDNPALIRVLTQCDGLPMLSAIATYDSITMLGMRLAAWCTVDVDAERFNFRFPDTRRLPAILDTLTQQQRCELMGSAIGWCYINRSGTWAPLPIDCGNAVAGITARAKLSFAQFARLIDDSETDDIWARLQYRGVTWDRLPSERNDLLNQAMQLARQHSLDDTSAFNWCSKLIAEVKTGADVSIAEAYSSFEKELTRLPNEELQNTV